MKHVNKVTLLGNVGVINETKTVGESKVLTLSLATNQKYKNDKGESVSKPTWHSVVAWNGLASVIEKYVRKGDPLYIEGSINNRSYEKDGQTRYISEVVCTDISLLKDKN